MSTTTLPDRTKQSSIASSRSEEVSSLLDAVKALIIPFIQSADEDAATKETGHGLNVKGGAPRTTLVEYHKPRKLEQLLKPNLPSDGTGRSGLLQSIQEVLQYSVNTWDQGFLDKLYASTDAVGVASELILAVLNTNVHVYQVSPALTVIEKSTTKALAHAFGLKGPHAGGISVQGGSASNTTSIVVARNNLFPDTKEHGNHAAGRKLVLFTSAHGHYSIEKAAQMLGFGSSAVWPVEIDSEGRMSASELEKQVEKAAGEGFTPFYVNATAGTTVLGSYDPFTEISNVCKKHNLWMHIDGSWGGPAIFSPTHASKLAGSHLADSIAINPHKMMGVPLTCSFLLGADMLQFHRANTLPAGYLFHSSADDASGHDASSAHNEGAKSGKSAKGQVSYDEIYDLADLTLQCGRRGDSLKLYLAWQYYGTSGFSAQIDHAFDTAAYMASIIAEDKDLVLVSSNPPPCLQVCFYYAKGGELHEKKDVNTQCTEKIANGLIRDGFMVDFAPGEKGSFFRCVVNRGTEKGTIRGLLTAVKRLGEEIAD
ncbi:hypothetical protein MMC25_002253 [Agyrium rufum]|nr:hypothetical protein [Agyrium rufum]